MVHDRPIGALVTDVHLRNAVAGLRALGRGGVSVLAVGPTRTAAGLWSRHADHSVVAPDVLSDARGFAERVSELADGAGVPVYPGREEAIDALVAAGRGDLLPYSNTESLGVVRDKRELRRIAPRHGIAVPRILVEGTARELLAAATLPTPCVVKAPNPGRRSTLERTQLCWSEPELRSLLGALANPDEQLVLQERVEGSLLSLELVVDRRGAIAELFHHVSLATWPAEAGGASAAVSIAPDEELAARARAMLASVGFWGMVQLQFVADPDDGPKLIDANPRFYGSLPLSLACGVNLPATWHRVVLGEGSPRPTAYPLGLRYRRLEADVSAALAGSPRRLAPLSPRPRAGAVWASDDPLPSGLLTSVSVRDRVRRELGRSAPERPGA